MIVLDTNVISELFRPHPEPRVIAWIESLTGEVAITTVTLAELLAGVQRLPEGRRKNQLSDAIRRAIEPYRSSKSLLPFDEAAAVEYAGILRQRERAGLPISMADAQIAAICRAHDAACATRNVDDFRETGVRLMNPWSPEATPPTTDG